MLPLIISLSAKLFGIDIIDIDDFLELVMRSVFNFTIILVLVRYIYYPITRKRDFLFTFLLIGTVVFLLTFLLESVKLQLGFALGLFAVFGIIRYRTTTISIKEMTYLFIVIGISVINALANKKVSYAELVFTNFAIIAITYFVEKVKSLENELYTVVTYENIELATPQHKEELIKDLEKRLGIKIRRIEISNLDYQRDTAKIRVYFFKSHQTWANMEEIDYRILSDE